MGPVTRSVLTNPPAFCVRPSASRRIQFLLRPAGSNILGSIKARAGLANNLLRFVSRNALRAGVPARDDSDGIQHHQAVILFALDQQPETLLALTQRLLGLFTAGNVRGNACQAIRDPSGIDQGE